MKNENGNKVFLLIPVQRDFQILVLRQGHIHAQDREQIVSLLFYFLLFSFIFFSYVVHGQKSPGLIER
jgi:hypothetical protein